MGAILSRFLWFFVVASLLSYSTFLVVGNIANAHATGKNLPVVIRDELGVGVHHLSGMVMVATSCDQVSVRTEAISDTTFALVFRTWREPSAKCALEETPRYFRAILFAPSAGVEFVATLDDVSFPIVVAPNLSNRIIFE